MWSSLHPLVNRRNLSTSLVKRTSFTRYLRDTFLHSATIRGAIRKNVRHVSAGVKNARFYSLSIRPGIEMKSVERLLSLHYKQVLTYLKLSGLSLGLLVNFNTALSPSFHAIICFVLSVLVGRQSSRVKPGIGFPSGWQTST